MSRMLHVLSYDISDNKRRRAIAKYMEGIGRRVQESVFETYMTSKQMQRTISAVQPKLMSLEGDSLRVYRVCSACSEASRFVGGIRIEWDKDIFL